MAFVTKPMLVALGGLAWVCLYTPTAVSAPPVVESSLGDRVAQLENRLNTGTLVELLNRVDALQNEVQELRGEVERKTHALDQLKHRQRELYLDVDRRLQQVETGGGATAAPGRGPTTGQPVLPQPAPPAAAPAVKAAPPATPLAVKAATPAAAPAAKTPAPIPEPVTAASPEEPEADLAKEQATFQAAFDMLREGRHAPAAKALHEFIVTYPRSKFANNAKYWIAEIHYVTRRFAKALTEFQELIDNYPDSAKVGKAKLQIGKIHYEMGNIDQAKTQLEEVISSYPNSSVGRLARNKLLQIQKSQR